MADGVLYFPYMRVPQDAWFTRVLLYWDRVSAIIPPTYRRDGETLGGYSIELIEQGLLSPLSPDEHYFPALAEGFRQVLAGAGVEGRPGTIAREAERDTLIHVSKMGLDLAAELRDLGLARPAEYGEDGFWVSVEPSTATMYMTYLAVVLGKRAGISPITDDTSAIAVLDGSNSGAASGLERADRLQMAVIDAILPAPVDPIPVTELRRFKDEHHAELTALRVNVEAAVLDLINESDPEIRARRVALLRTDLGSQVASIRDQMRRPKWPRILFGGVCGIGAAVAPLVATAAGASVAETLLTMPGFLSGVYGALGSLKHAEEATRSPLAYAAFAQEAFGSPSAPPTPSS